MRARTASAPLRPARLVAELALAGAGLALFAAAARLDRGWVDRHVLLPFYFAPGLPAWATGVARAAAAAAGALLIFVVRPRVGRRVASAPPDRKSLAGVMVAMVASVLAIELVLRVAPLGPASGSPRYELRVGQRHPRFGWVSRPSRTTPMSTSGRRYQYAVNALGVRASTESADTDVSRPALVVTGESIANGYGLSYEQTFAARCGHDLGLQVVNVAEGGYGLDQAYLRLMDILPRLQRPSVVVTVFVGPELGRLTRDDRPRLAVSPEGGLELVPRATGIFTGTRLHDIFQNRLPYLTEASLQRSLHLSAELLQAIARAAVARGARPLFVIPSVGPPRPLGQHRERELVQTLFVDPGLPYVVIDLPIDELNLTDRHPNEAGARRIASAIEAALQPPPPLQASAPGSSP